MFNAWAAVISVCLVILVIGFIVGALFAAFAANRGYSDRDHTINVLSDQLNKYKLLFGPLPEEVLNDMLDVPQPDVDITPELTWLDEEAAAERLANRLADFEAETEEIRRATAQDLFDQDER